MPLQLVPRPVAAGHAGIGTMSEGYPCCGRWQEQAYPIEREHVEEVGLVELSLTCTLCVAVFHNCQDM